MATWVDTVRAMGKWYEHNVHAYQSRGDTSGHTSVSTARGSSGNVLFYACPIIGGKECGNDCCGFVGSCLTAFGVEGLGYGNKASGMFGAGAYVNNAKLSSILSGAGFQRMNFDSNNLQEGDIYASSGHVEIFAGYNGSASWKSWGWGNIHDGRNGNAGQPNSTGLRPGQSGKYQVLWRYTGNKNVTLGADGMMYGGSGFPEGTTFMVTTPRSEQLDHILMEELASVKMHLMKEIFESSGILFDENNKHHSVDDLFLYDKFRLPILNTEWTNWEIKNKTLQFINNVRTDNSINTVILDHYINPTQVKNGTYHVKYNNTMAKPEDNGDATIGEGIANKAVEMGLIQLGCMIGGIGDFVFNWGEHSGYAEEYAAIEKTLSQIMSSSHKAEFIEFLNAMIADGAPGTYVAVFAGCSLQECAGNIHVINKTEYDGTSKNAQTHGWNAGESTAGFTFWSLKEKLIKQYNKMSVTKKLPETWGEYSKGRPRDSKGGHYEFSDNGNHICDLCASDMAKITNILYKPVFEGLSKHGNNLPAIVAELFLRKSGHDKHTDDRIADAYYAGEVYKKFNKRQHNSYLEAVKYCELFLSECGSELGISSGTGGTGGAGGEIKLNGSGGGTAFLNKIFGQPVPTNTGTAGVQSGQKLTMPSWMAQQMVSVNVFGKQHQVHKSAAANFTAVWNDIQKLNLPYKVVSSGTLSFRVVNNKKYSSNMALSKHAYGLAIDINVPTNPFAHGAKAPKSGQPTNTSAMRSFDHPVVQAFLRHGFGWGGAYGDYMHFSIPSGN